MQRANRWKADEGLRYGISVRDERDDDLRRWEREARQRGDSDRARALRAVIDGVGQENQLPLVFLSYPGEGSVLARRFMAALRSEGFRVGDYQHPDNRVLVDGALDGIHACDMFIGFWHHDKPDGNGEIGLSPWMPFEYGVARSLNKPTLVLQSRHLTRDAARRIEGGVGTIRFDERTFLSDTLPIAVAKAVDTWEQHQLA